MIASWNFALDHAPRGLLREIDRAMLTSWVVAEHIHRKAARQVFASQLLIKTQSGSIVQSPMLGILNRQVVLMKALAAEMGFSPAARTTVASEPTDEDNAEEKYFGRG
jgi:P27 family predicted phage terminase small subunit